MVFASAILGFVLNLLLENTSESLGCAKAPLIISTFLLALSLPVDVDLQSTSHKETDLKSGKKSIHISDQLNFR
jgi:hypothetical protein